MFFPSPSPSFQDLPNHEELAKKMNTGLWKNARGFKNLAERTPTQSSNLLLTLCSLGRLKEALQTLTSTKPISSLHPSLYSSLLQLCIDSNAEKEGRFVHDHLLRNGVVPDLCLNNKLINFYSRIGDVVAARDQFDEMTQPNVVSWTALISGYSRNGYPKEALEVFLEMRRSGFRGNQFTFGSVLRVCTSMMCLGGGKQIQGCVEKSRFCEDLFVQSALVDFHSKCGKIEDARGVFERMSNRDVVSWNVVIGGYAVQGLGADAFGMFRLMLRDGMIPDHFTFGSILRACGGVRPCPKVKQIHGFIVQLGFESDSIVTGALIDAYSKCRILTSARLLYDSMREKDLVSCTALITGYAKEGSYCGDALEVFSEIYRMNMGMDDVIMCSMLNICANAASLSVGRQIHACAFKNQPKYDVAVGNALIDMYSKSGEIKDACRAFDEMQEKNEISWTSLITGYGKHGHFEEAIALFEKMENDGFKPNDVTFLSILFACSHTGNINSGWQFFNSMVSKYNIHPRAEHYSCVIDLLARGGQLKEAYDLACNMSVKPSTSVWGAILGACRLYGNSSLGTIVAQHLFDLDPKNPVNYVVLANIYADAGLWEYALKTRKLMEEICTRKEPGYSSIQFTKDKGPLLLETNLVLRT